MKDRLFPPVLSTYQENQVVIWGAGTVGEEIHPLKTGDRTV